MASIQNQIVLITGASSGIGAACAHFFAEAGARLILAARRLERLEERAAALRAKFGTETLLLQLDVGDRPRVESTLSALPKDWAAVDILVNNAGLSRGLDKLHEGQVQDWEEMIDTNVKGLLYVTRAILPGMVQRDRGHVINIGSIAGHQPYPGGNVYCATKAAVKSLTECLKLDLLGTAVRITSVDPGMVETEFSEVRFHGDGDRARKVYQGLTPLTAEDIADVVLYCATRPAHVNINDVILMPVAQASTTMAHRRP
ncbi:SDR family oxidoreductase [Thermoleptolyngbya sp. M55_K2018_002]|uniref:SDR family oxidoreductase n=1 Tax=Thermoleptolyngbya sp. M55_K2018_002 TaxID=2747808 RepID=UPI0019FC0C07|nr:SDR family oxidoreductase [Thermoleptolyngbya sp. M55_K2018_002]HIK42671.1 SDR family oxidoreductase [Thermoleptolyngbya sp. M55_K2018_002]